MNKYPNLDTEISTYRVGLSFDADGFKNLFPGGHDNFSAAAERARKLCSAVKSCGEVGVKPYVTFSGERPDNFPRNGIIL